MVLLHARENISYSKEVRERANSPGQWSIYLFSRLEHPVIRGQIEGLIFLAGRGKYSKERIAREYDERLAKIRSFTPISFRTQRSRTSEGPFGPEEIISLRATRRDTGKKYTCKELHITESHEKGHVMRFEYAEEWTPGLLGMRAGYVLAGLFGKAFDFSGVEFSKEEYQRYRSRNSASAKKSDTEIRKIWIAYLASPHDLAERMSQLKNYFGFCGEEIFTKEHLWYAREHYVKDTNYDNAMSPFFAAILPEKEEVFLELMNSAGI
jgi:hypothetical protein